MTDLVDIQPFGIVIEEMEFTVREFFIPKVLKTDGDDGPDGGFGDDHPIDATGVILSGRLKKILGR
jgi:hypothetical protein